MKKLLLTVGCLLTCLPLVYAQSQPTPSMQEQYDKMHGSAPKKTTSTTPKSSTTSKSTAQKPTISKSAASGGGIGFSLGVRGGGNYCSATFTDNTFNPRGILGYHGGLIFNIGSERFSVQPEVLYSQVGFKTKVSSLFPGTQPTTAETSIKNNTLTVPILFKMAFGQEDLKLFVNAGGYGSYALNGISKTNLNGTTSTQKVDFSNSDGRIEYGAVGGAGVSLKLGPAKLLLEGRYYLGLANNTRNSPALGEVYFRTIQGSVGVLLPLGGR